MIEFFKPSDIDYDQICDETPAKALVRICKYLNEKLEASGEIMYRFGKSSDPYIVPSQKIMNSHVRPTHKVLVINIEETPPCQHQEVWPLLTSGMGEWHCKACGVEMVPYGFKVKNDGDV